MSFLRLKWSEPAQTVTRWGAVSTTGNAPAERRLGDDRVSGYGQNLDAQLEPLRGGGYSKIYREG